MIKLKELDSVDILTVIRNQRKVPSELLFSYKGQPNQLDLLIEIIAKCQAVEPTAEGFRLFIYIREKEWTNWALTAKLFRKWLDSTHYSYEFTSQERLAELFSEDIEMPS